MTADAGSGARARATVLVADLDGTLVRTDTLHEALLDIAAHRPLALPGLLRALPGGKAAFKAAVARQVIAAPEALPLNDEVIAVLRDARDRGVRTALVSAANQAQVDAVAEALGLFDEAHGSDAGRNLSGSAKAAFLTERYGDKGFDYLGDAQKDVPVWTAARQAITVGASESLRRAAERANPDIRHLSPPPTAPARVAPYLRAMRPYQWAKNLLVFLPMLAAHTLAPLGSVIAAFVAFSLVASSVYLCNDLLDLRADRAHPRKRLRPFAAGAIPLSHGLWLGGALLAAGIGVAVAFTPPLFLLYLGLYYAATWAYSLVLKRMLTMDVMVLAALYTARIMAGGAAASVALSPWMLAFSGFLFLSLATVKRLSELVDLQQAGKAEREGRAYRVSDIQVLMAIAIASGYSAVLVLALYVSGPDVRVLYSSPNFLLLLCPIVLYWISRMVMTTNRGDMTDDPIIFAAKDRETQLLVVLAAVIVAVAAYL